MRKANTFKIITFGCKVNQYESAYIGEKLKEEKWMEAEADQAADVYIINTCIVTERAAFQSRQAVRRARRANPQAKIAVIGCYVQAYEQELTSIPGIHLLSGNVGKSELPGVIIRLMNEEQIACRVSAFVKKTAFDFMPIRGFLDRTRAFLKIQDGCESYCSYCIVPYARGPLRSLEPEKVITNMQALAQEGYREVVLTGIHLGKYGSDLGSRTTLPDLLKRIGDEKLPLRIRLSSLEPQEVHESLIEMMATENWLCRHLHVPLQSGDDQILKKMNRHYTAQQYKNLIKKIRQKIPGIKISTDIIVGFPGETKKQFQNTLKLCKEIKFNKAYIARYSLRPGTPAAKLKDNVSLQEKKHRWQILENLINKKHVKKNV